MTASSPALLLIIGVLVGFACGALSVIMTRVREVESRARAAQESSSAREREQSRLLAQSQADAAAATAAREAALEERAGVLARAASLEGELTKLRSEATQTERTLRDQIGALQADLATEKTHLHATREDRDGFATDLAAVQADLMAIREAAITRERDLSKQLAEATAAQAATQKAFDELKTARAEADSKFAELANKIITDAQASLIQSATEKVKVENDAARAEAQAKLATISAEMTTKLGELGAAVGNLQAARENDSVTLTERLAALNTQTSQLLGAVSETQTATNRVANLLSHRQNRGAWGEFELQRLIELTGMTKNVSFNVQQTGFGDDERGRPDLVVHVAGGGMLPIDAKVPFDAYQASIEATEDAARAEKFADAIAAFRGHIRTLATRRYHATPGCIGWTLAFVPIESMLSSLLAADSSILVDAMDSKILIVSPMTLFAYLTTIAHGWTLARQQENAEHILVSAKTLVERLAPFASHLEKVGAGLHRAMTSYNDAVGSFDRSVVSQARRIHELSGAPVLEAPPERDVELRAVDVTRYAGLSAVPEQSLALLPAESA